MSADSETLVRRFFEELCNGRRGEVAEDALGLLQEVGAAPMPARA
jgi:hypothetical protein